MANVHPQRIRDVFTQAMELPAAERDAYLQEASKGDLALLAHLRSLLNAYDSAGDFLGSPTEAPTIDQPSSGPSVTAPGEAVGTRIGPYKLLQQIGEGGFGVVYLAEQQEPLVRRVALKIIKLGMDTRQVIARFEAERQALAMMDHPNIARVLDAGATEIGPYGAGRPYFVMELVKGDPITEYCDKNNLSISARLELFAQACHAVQHAHQKGIIHRDLKPSNILVSTQDGRPHAKVIDFGIAKATNARLTEKTLFTEHRQLIGTPEYMSPEQAEGSLDIDTRTDVYSLGVLLYELLTGSTPFDSKQLRSAAFGEIQRIIREVEPPNPSTRLSQSAHTLASVAANRRLEPRRLGSMVRGELDWIVMKALEKDRSRRYETANGLAMDIARYLGGEAVVAAPPSTAYRVKKFVRRNKGAVTAGAAVAAALLIGVVAFAWQAQIARHQRDLAMQAQQAEAEQRQAADAQRDRAVKAEAETARRAEELTQVADFQASQLSDLDPQLMGSRLRASMLAASPDSSRAALTEGLTAINFTNIALGSLKENIFDRTLAAIEKQFVDQPLVKARLLETMALTLKTLGLSDRALGPQTEAMEIRRRDLGPEHPDTLTSISNMGVVLNELGRADEAETHYLEALASRRRVLGDEHPDSLTSLSNTAFLLLSQGKYAESEAMYRQAMDGRRHVLGNEHRETLMSVNGTGYALVMQGKLAEGEPYWREAYETGKRVLGADDPDVLVWINNMGGLIGSQGRHQEAEPFYREAMETNRRVFGDEHPSTLLCIDNVAMCVQQQGRYPEAETLRQECLETGRRVLGADHPNTLGSALGMAGLLRSQGRLSESEVLMREVLDARRRTLGLEHPDTISATSNMAQLLMVMDRLDEAEVLYREALGTAARTLGEEHPDTLVIKNNFGSVLMQTKRLEEAEPLLRGALEARRRVSGENHPETLILITSVGRVLELSGKLEEAEPFYRDSFRRFEQTAGVDHPNYFSAANNLGILLKQQGRLDEAEPLLRLSVEGMVRVLGPDHARTGNAHLEYGNLLTKMNRFAEAEGELLEAERVYTKAQGVSKSRRTQLLNGMVLLYEAWNTAEPGKGHDAKTAEWKIKLDAMQPPATAPAPPPEAPNQAPNPS